MKALIETLITEHNAKQTLETVLKFTINGDDYVYFTDEQTLYGSVDGDLLPGSSKVKTVKVLQKFIALRA